MMRLYCEVFSAVQQKGRAKCIRVVVDRNNLIAVVIIA
jgi:hypothetical protein